MSKKLGTCLTRTWDCEKMEDPEIGSLELGGQSELNIRVVTEVFIG